MNRNIGGENLWGEYRPSDKSLKDKNRHPHDQLQRRLNNVLKRAGEFLDGGDTLPRASLKSWKQRIEKWIRRRAELRETGV